MSSADLQTVVIACPNCGTRYQVPFGAIGTAGREVQCAQCSKPWHAVADIPPPPAIRPPDEDRLFSPADERALDEAFEAAERAAAPAADPLPPSVPRDPDHERTLAEIKAAIMPRPKKSEINELDPAQLNKSRRAFAQRQRRLTSGLPIARVRRTARVAALVVLLGLLAIGFFLRTELVRAYPALAGVYAAIGLPVNVVGLTFDSPKTVMSYRDGKQVMLITARIRSTSARSVVVPPVLVSLIDANGRGLYEWTVDAKARDMEPGEVLDFSTEVNSPPPGVVTVRLTFTTPRGGSAVPAGTL